jgi:hypothetical protein
LPGRSGPGDASEAGAAAFGVAEELVRALTRADPARDAEDAQADEQ